MPESIENGEATVEARPRESVNVFGMIVSYKCNQGYFLSTDTSSFLCGENGEWNSENLNPKCVEGGLSCLLLYFFNYRCFYMHDYLT